MKDRSKGSLWRDRYDGEIILVLTEPDKDGQSSLVMGKYGQRRTSIDWMLSRPDHWERLAVLRTESRHEEEER